jgi:predicted site-specific integrase-resolvase
VRINRTTIGSVICKGAVCYFQVFLNRANYLFIEVENDRVARIIIAHKDRLIRLGYEWFNGFCERHNCEIIVINAESLSPEEEVTKDLLTIMHCFSLRLYGLRRYRKEITEMVVSHEND